MRCRTLPGIRAAACSACLLVSVGAPQAAAAGPNDPGLARFWADFGLGYGHMSAGASAPADSGGGGVWLDAQVGGRLTSQWLVGFNLGGVGLHAASHNYDPNISYSSIYGQAVTNAFLVMRFEPESDHGWWLGAGAGKVLYDNKALQAVSGNVRSGNGTGGIARVGYDWRLRPRSHLEAALSFEAGRVALNAPFSGRFNYSVLALSAHIAYH
jgi:hypothetical protein